MAKDTAHFIFGIERFFRVYAGRARASVVFAFELKFKFQYRNIAAWRTCTDRRGRRSAQIVSWTRTTRIKLRTPSALL